MNREVYNRIDDRGENNSTFEVYYTLAGGSTIVNGKPYNDGPKGIMHARSWRNPGDFAGDYDKKVSFPVFNSHIIVAHQVKDAPEASPNALGEPIYETDLDHGVSETYTKKEYPGYRYDSFTIQYDDKPVETKYDTSIKVTGINKMKSQEYSPDGVLDENSYKNATLTFLYTPVEVSGTHQLKADPDNQLVEAETIGHLVDITIDLTQGAQSVEDWEAYLKGETSVLLNVDVHSNNSQSDIQPNPHDSITLSPDQLLEYLGGKKLSYTDNLVDYPIAGGETVEITYDADISVEVRDKTITLEGGEDTASFYRKPETDGYVSSPSYWAEIKQGDVYQEEFEAMAGTPTTKDLYFTSGGSEFMVEIEVEYVPHATQTRSYRSYFNKVPCELKEKHQGPLHSGGLSFQKGRWSTSSVSAPEPRSITAYDNSQIYETTGVGTRIVTFDYTKINKVNVWKIKEAKVDGMIELLEDDDVTATIPKQQKPLRSPKQAKKTCGTTTPYPPPTGAPNTSTWAPITDSTKDPMTNMTAADTGNE